MGDWKLVRRVQAGNAWHPATDRCEGSEVYNADQVPTHSTSTADVTFSLNFEETVPEYDELMFDMNVRNRRLQSLAQGLGFRV